MATTNNRCSGWEGRICNREDQCQHKLKKKKKKRTGACANTSRGTKCPTFKEVKVVPGGWSRMQGWKSLEMSGEMLL